MLKRLTRSTAFKSVKKKKKKKIQKKSKVAKRKICEKVQSLIFAKRASEI